MITKQPIAELRKRVTLLLNHPDWMVRMAARKALEAKGAEARRLCNVALQEGAACEAFEY